MSRLALLLFLTLAACAGGGGSPQLRVLGVHDRNTTHETVFVQVTNPANHPMRLTRLQYAFAASGQTVAQGEIPLERDVEAGAAAIVEVPFEGEATGQMTMTGRLTTTLDRIEQTYSVSAQVSAK